jgi:hypothetical protein
VIFAEFNPAENQGQSRGELIAAETARLNDPWDGWGRASGDSWNCCVRVIRAPRCAT